MISWEMTRLTRNLRDTVRIIELGEKHDTVLAFCRGSDLDLSTPMGRMLATILASVARQEIENKSERQKRANVQAARNGKRVGGARPFGYEADGKTIKADEADAIRRAYDDVLAGVSLSAIARDWNEAGLFTPQKTRKGEPSEWGPDTIRPVLLNPRYCGKRGYAPKPEHGRSKYVEIHEAVWDGLVSEEVWQAVNRELSNPDRYLAGGRHDKHLLTGVAVCGICGATVHGGGMNRPGYRVYRCSASGHLAPQAEPVEEWVEEVTLARLSRPDAAELLRDDHRPDIPALRSEALALRVRQDQLAASFAEGEISHSQLTTGTEKIRAKLVDIESRMGSTLAELT